MHFSKKSFTLAELVAAIFIMGLLAAIVLPRFVKWGFVGSLTLRTAAAQATSDIRYARQLAVTNAGHYLINFDFVAGEYKIYKDSISPANQIGETKKIPSGVTGSGTGRFDFYALGNCLFSGAGLLLSLSTGQYQISAEPTTGAVVIEKIS